MSTETIQAIDVHAHLGPYEFGDELTRRFMSGDVDCVVDRANRARTRCSIISFMQAFYPEESYDVFAANEESRQAAEGNDRLRFWAVLDPQGKPNFTQVEGLLKHPKCAGIKIHPELHPYGITDYGQAIFSFAAKFEAVVTTHSGQERSLPQDFMRFADAFPEVNLILAHLGFCYDGDMTAQVRAIQSSKHGNIYTDTSSARSITSRLLEWAVDEVGADKILYGTDTPLYFAPMHRARIDYAELTDEQKQLILCGNAERLLKL